MKRMRQVAGALFMVLALCCLITSIALANVQEEHNCRFWGLISESSTSAVFQDQLIDQPYSLENLSSANPDGWGIGYYPTGTDTPTMLRGATTAISDPQFDIAVNQVALAMPRIAVAHVRNASSGLIPPTGDPHPFERVKLGRHWLMGHNGTIDKSVLVSLIRPDYLAANPPQYGSSLAEWIDSDLYLIYMMQTIEDFNGNVKPALAYVIRTLRDALPGTGERINFFLTDGTTLWGYRQGNTLWYLYENTGIPYSVLASEPPTATGAGWTELSDGQFITLFQDRPPIVEEISIYYGGILFEDNFFDTSIDDADLRADGTGQDWYESRNDAPTLVTLNNDVVGGNGSPKAHLTATGTTNAYLTQEFVTPISTTFAVQWDIYIDEIIDTDAPDRGGVMLIGDDTVAGNGPNANNDERFVYMAFLRDGGGTSGTMELVARDRDDGWTAFSTIATGLNMDQWYTIKVICDLEADMYEVYINGVYQATVSSRMTKTEVTHISFATWNDGPGTFYVDNVLQAMDVPLQTLTLAVDPPGAGVTVPSIGDHSYAHNEVVAVSAMGNSGYAFDHWSGNVNDPNSASTTITMAADETITAHFVSVPIVFLADNDFNASLDDADLRANGPGQDWYESRNDAPTLLTLNTANVGGNIGAKALLTATGTTNAYLSQEFGAPQTGLFSVQWDIYVDEIMNISEPDRGGVMLIGDDSYSGNGPNANNDERFVYLAFFRDGGGTSGTMNLVARDRDDDWAAFTTIATGLNMDQWYTIQVICDLDADTYDVYVDGAYQATVSSRMVKSSVTHISFATWNDGAGTFYVDNVYEVTENMFSLTMAVDPAGAGFTEPPVGTRNYIDGTEVAVSATANTGYRFDHWTGDVAEPLMATTTVLVDADKSATAFFVEQFALVAAVEGNGAVVMTPPGGLYDYNAVVDVEAVADPGWVFTGWSGDYIGTENPVSLTMTGDYSITAAFQSILPQITSTPVTSVTTGQTYLYDVDAIGVGDLYYSLPVSPAGMTIDAVTGEINWLTSNAGAFDVIIQVENLNGATTQEYTIFVASGPALGLLELTSTSGHFLTSDDLTCQYTLAGEATVAATSWNKNGAPLMTLYMPFEGGTTNALNDYSGNGHDVTFAIDTMAWNATNGVAGSGAFTFGSHKYLLAGNVFPTHSSYTKAAWIYRTANNYSYNHILCGEVYGQGGHHLRVSLVGELVAGHSGRNDIVVDPGDIARNQWYFVAVTYDYGTGEMVLYKNGVAVNAATVPTEEREVTDAILKIGSIWTAWPWEGRLDEVRVYPEALSPEQIAALYVDGQTIVAEETTEGDTWQAVVTPFSSTAAGQSQFTDEVVIVGAVTNTLTVNIAPVGGGTTVPTAGVHNYPQNFVVDLIATPVAGYAFDHWEGNVTDPNAASTTVTLTGDVTVTAHFRLIPTYTLTIAADPTAGGTTEPAAGAHVYFENTEVIVTAVPASGYMFGHWTGNVVDPNAATTSVTMNADETITAHFTQIVHNLTIAANDHDAGIIDPAEGVYAYPENTVVPLSAVPYAGYRFDSWSGDVVDPDESSTAIQMTEDKSVTANFSMIPAVFLADTDFSASVDVNDFRLNRGGQDWYESRGDAPSLLTLETDNIGGNIGAKAKMTGSTTNNAYLSQEFGVPQTSTFSVQWDIYVDEILNISAPDRAGVMLIGDDSFTGGGPNADNSERFVYLAFFRNGGGTSGTMDLVARDRDDGWTAFTTVATGLSLDQWYTIRVDCDLDADTYDIYVDDVYRASVSSRIAKTAVTHISFAQWNDGSGTFFVDNVRHVVQEPIITSITPQCAEPGETIDLTVSGQHLFFGQGTLTQVTLSHEGFVVPTSGLVIIDEDNLVATFDLPLEAPPGQYGVDIDELGIGSIGSANCLIVANSVGGEWQLSLTATGESIDNAADASAVTIGIGATPYVEDGPPNPIDYTVDMKLYQQDWRGPYITDIQENAAIAYSWIIGLNPHGNVAPPITERCAVLHWNPADFIAGSKFQLVDMGIDGTDNTIVVEDMSLATEFQVCGLDIPRYLKIVYWNENGCVDMALAEGWQLVSLPVNPADNSLGALFPDCIAAWKYDNASGQYLAAATIEPCRGYWLKMPADVTYPICGSVVGCSGAYDAGWHLIGGPDCIATPISNPVGNILALWMYDASAAMYFAAADIDPFLGYWIKLQNDGTITMDCGGKSAVNTIVAASKGTVENHILHIGIEGQSLGGVSAGEVIIGLDDVSQYYPAAPAPPEYSASIASYHSDWSGPYYEDIRLNEADNTFWILAVNPHGNIAPPAERTAILTWLPGEMGNIGYELREGFDGTGAILIEDMRTVNSFAITGTNQNYYFTVGPSKTPTGVDDDEALPTEFALRNNYPNPFNPTTTIEYTLPRVSDVTIDVFNIAGQKVARLVNESQEAGEHSVIWDGKDQNGQVVSSGIYFYRISAGAFIETKKMMLLK